MQFKGRASGGVYVDACNGEPILKHAVDRGENTTTALAYATGSVVYTHPGHFAVWPYWPWRALEGARGDCRFARRRSLPETSWSRA